VPVNTNRLDAVIGKGVEGRKRSMAIVALAGPVSNVVQASVAALSAYSLDLGLRDLATVAFSHQTESYSGIEAFLLIYLWINVLLASFNMIPIPPLDGHKILVGILPNFWYSVLAPLERYGFVVLFAVFYLGDRLSGPGERTISGELYAPLQNLLIRVFF
jgi:Zn-dependent protease